eukprot:gene26223-32763_t
MRDGKISTNEALVIVSVYLVYVGLVIFMYLGSASGLKVVAKLQKKMFNSNVLINNTGASMITTGSGKQQSQSIERNLYTNDTDIEEQQHSVDSESESETESETHSLLLVNPSNLQLTNTSNSSANTSSKNNNNNTSSNSPFSLSSGDGDDSTLIDGTEDVEEAVTISTRTNVIERSLHMINHCIAAPIQFVLSYILPQLHPHPTAPVIAITGGGVTTTWESEIEEETEALLPPYTSSSPYTTPGSSGRFVIDNYNHTSSSLSSTTPPRTSSSSSSPLPLKSTTPRRTKRVLSKEELVPLWRAIAVLVVSIVCIGLLASGIVSFSEAIVRHMGIDTSTLGATLVALGAEIPDTISSISLARNGYYDGAIAGAIGSQVINISLGVGLPALFVCLTGGEGFLAIAQNQVDSLWLLTTHHDSIANSMTVRNMLLETTRNIEALEADYLRSTADHDLLDRELSVVLNSPEYSDLFGGQSHSNGSSSSLVVHTSSSSQLSFSASKASHQAHKMDASLLEIISQGATPLSHDLVEALKTGSVFRNQSDATPADSAADGSCDFSLSEVLDESATSSSSSSAGVQRSNGEEAVQYLIRLQRRLSGLRVLETQVRGDFETKLTQVKRDKEQMQEVEIRRLRVELQVSHLTGSSSSNHLYNRQQKSLPSSGTKPPRSAVKGSSKKDEQLSYYDVLSSNQKREVQIVEDDYEDSEPEESSEGASPVNRNNLSAYVDFDDIYRPDGEKKKKTSKQSQQQSATSRNTMRNSAPSSPVVLGEMDEFILSPKANPLAPAQHQRAINDMKRKKSGAVAVTAAPFEVLLSTTDRGGRKSNVLNNRVSVGANHAPRLHQQYKLKQQMQQQQQVSRRVSPQRAQRNGQSSQNLLQDMPFSPQPLPNEQYDHYPVTSSVNVSGLLEDHLSSSTFESMSAALKNKQQRVQQQQNGAANPAVRNSRQPSPQRVGGRATGGNGHQQQQQQQQQQHGRSGGGGSHLSSQQSHMQSNPLNTSSNRNHHQSQSHSQSHNVHHHSSQQDSAHYEASILDQLLHHSRALQVDSFAHQVVDNESLLRQQDEVNRLILLYLASSSSSSAITTQLKVKVLSNLLSRDLSSGDVQQMSSAYTSKTNSTNTTPKQKTSSVAETIVTSTMNATNMIQNKTTVHSSSHLSNEMELEQLLVERNAAKLQQAQQEVERLAAEQKSLQKVSIPPLISSSEAEQELREQETRVVAQQPEKVRASQEFRKVSASRPPAIDTLQPPTKEEEMLAALSPMSEHSSALTVVVTPDRIKQARHRYDVNNQQLALTSEGALTCTSDMTGSSPCQCKYCTADNYSYQTLYDRNGHYIGPPELKPTSGNNSVSGSSTKASKDAKDVYLHSYFSPAEVAQMAQKRQGSRPTSAGSASGHRSASKAPLTADEKHDMSVFGSTAPARKSISHIPRYHKEEEQVGAEDFISALQTAIVTAPLPKRLSSPSPTKRTVSRFSHPTGHQNGEEDEEVVEHRRHTLSSEIKHVNRSADESFHVGSKPYIGCRLCSKGIRHDSGAVSELTTNDSAETDKKHTTPVKDRHQNSTDNHHNAKDVHSGDQKRKSFPIATSHRNETAKKKKTVMDDLDLAISSLEAHKQQQEERVEQERVKSLVTQSASKLRRSSIDMLQELTEGFKTDPSSGNIMSTSPVLRETRTGSNTGNSGQFVIADDMLTSPTLSIPSAASSRKGSRDFSNYKAGRLLSRDDQESAVGGGEDISSHRAQQVLGASLEAFMSLLKENQASHEAGVSAVNISRAAVASTSRPNSANRRGEVSAVVRRLQKMAESLEHTNQMNTSQMGGTGHDDVARAQQEYLRSLRVAGETSHGHHHNTESHATFADETHVSNNHNIAFNSEIYSVLRRIEHNHTSVLAEQTVHAADTLNNTNMSGQYADLRNHTQNASMHNSLNSSGGVSTIRSGYLLNTLDRQKREIEELRRTQHALEILLDSDAQINALRTTQQHMIDLLEGSSSSEQYAHLLNTANELNAAELPQSLNKSETYVRARSRSNSHDSLAEHGTLNRSAEKHASRGRRNSDESVHVVDDLDLDRELSPIKRSGQSKGSHRHARDPDSSDEYSDSEDNRSHSQSPRRSRNGGRSANTSFQPLQSESRDDFVSDLHPAPADQTHYLNASVFQEMSDFLSQRVALCGDRHSHHSTHEVVDDTSGIARNAHDGTSKGCVEVTVISARNLPEMKKLHKSADAYTELTLATIRNTHFQKTDLLQI